MKPTKQVNSAVQSVYENQVQAFELELARWRRMLSEPDAIVPLTLTDPAGREVLIRKVEVSFDKPSGHREVK